MILLVLFGTNGISAQNNKMTNNQLKDSLYNFIKPTYPSIEIEVNADKNGKNHIYFTEKKFELLYPQQRYHYLIHKIPEDFYNEYLQNTVWYELAPDEKPEDLDYHDEETIKSIKDIILEILKAKTDFVKKLDSQFIKNDPVECFGDFRHSKSILTNLGFNETEQFDIFHVLMHEGGYCDCELLYNVFRESEYSKNYWKNRKK